MKTIRESLGPVGAARLVSILAALLSGCTSLHLFDFGVVEPAPLANSTGSTSSSPPSGAAVTTDLSERRPRVMYRSARGS